MTGGTIKPRPKAVLDAAGERALDLFHARAAALDVLDTVALAARMADGGGRLTRRGNPAVLLTACRTARERLVEVERRLDHIARVARDAAIGDAVDLAAEEALARAVLDGVRAFVGRLHRAATVAATPVAPGPATIADLTA